IRSKNTQPEIYVRKLLCKMGYRYRLHRLDLPGKPDIVFPRLKKAIFVHGCFWHQHGCRQSMLPKSRVKFWRDKLNANKARDLKNIRLLKNAGWGTLIVWQCGMKGDIKERLRSFMNS